MARKRVSVIYKINSYMTVLDNGCWEWIGKINKNTGYGQVRDYKKTKLAHRVSYEVHKGKIPSGLTIDHLCKNRKCINPMHLEAVTQKENTLRGNGVAGINARKTHCLRGHLLEGNNIYHRKDRTGRYCKSCQKIRLRKKEINVS